jgi:hypothetical protein
MRRGRRAPVRGHRSEIACGLRGIVIRRGEWSELGSRDIDYTTRGAMVRVRDAIESIRAAGSRIG